MVAVLFDAPDMYASARVLLDRGFATPLEAQATLDHLPEVVPDAALDPPERIPGALDVVVGAVPAGGDDVTVDWQGAPVAIAVLVLGTAPALVVRRRLLARAAAGP